MMTTGMVFAICLLTFWVFDLRRAVRQLAAELYRLKMEKKR